MKKITSLFALILIIGITSKSLQAQTAMPLSGPDCNGTNHDLMADLDAGKAVLIHFFMPSCGSCPPPAQRIQNMANNILATYPGMITAYAMPFNNTTTCTYTASWVTSNNLPLYAPYDSGAAQVAHYGGFGMPTVVLLGGTDHRVMFSTLSFSTSDTTIMRDSILRLLGGASTSVQNLPTSVGSFSIFPNPATSEATVQLQMNLASNFTINLLDNSGKLIMNVADEKNIFGAYSISINTAILPNGLYNVQFISDGNVISKSISVSH